MFYVSGRRDGPPLSLPTTKNRSTRRHITPWYSSFHSNRRVEVILRGCVLDIHILVIILFLKGTLLQLRRTADKLSQATGSFFNKTEKTLWLFI